MGARVSRASGRSGHGVAPAGGRGSATSGRSKNPAANKKKPAKPTGSAAVADGTDKASASWTDAVGADKKAIGLLRFAEYYPQARNTPVVPEGQATVSTFTGPQLEALHRAYWSVEPGADMAAMIAVATKGPAFKGRTVDERQVGRLCAKLPDSFPWGWRSRALAATSHALIDELLTKPRGTPVTEIIDGLTESQSGFPTYSAFKRAAREVWAEEPDRFPFAAELPATDAGGYALEAVGEVSGVEISINGGLAATEGNARIVAELAFDPRVRYDWSVADFAAFVEKEVGTTFTARSYQRIRDLFPGTVPLYADIRHAAMKGVAERVHQLYYDEGVTGADDIMKALHERDGYPLWHQVQLTFFRDSYPDFVPNLRAIKDEAVHAEAKTLLDAFHAHPDKTLRAVGKSLGHSIQRTKELIAVIRRHWPEALPLLEEHRRYTKGDVACLKRVLQDAPIGAGLADALAMLRVQESEFFERHPISDRSTLGTVLAKHAGVDSWAKFKQQRYTEAFAEILARTEPGATLTDLVAHMQEEYPGSYTLSSLKKNLLLAWHRTPDDFPKLAALRNEDGKYPWEYGKVPLTAGLADRVASLIADQPGRTLGEYVLEVKKDPEFAKDYPNFSVNTISHLRLKFPKKVPFVDDLQIRGQDARTAEAERRFAKLAERGVRAVAKLGDTTGLSIAALARRLKVPPHRLREAIQRHPASFPWYRERPAGNLDMYLATRIGYEAEIADLGVTAQQLVEKLKSDRTFNERYPAFNYCSLSALRERYPDLVPDFFCRDQVLRSKMIRDAVLRAPKGTKFERIIKRLEDKHPGFFRGGYASKDTLVEMWQAHPKRFPFIDALTSPSGRINLVGRGRKLPAEDTTDSELAARLARLEQIPTKLPLLDKITAKYGDKSKPFEKFEFLAIQHLLDTQVPTFDAYRSLGMNRDRTSVIGVPYSASPAVVDALQDKGWNVRVPPLELEIWQDDLREAMFERIASARKHGRKIVVLDDGGLVAKLLDSDPTLKEHSHLFRIVEQTRRGITVADGVDLSSPLVNVAQSWGKFVEGPMIGSSVEDKLLSRLERIGVKSVKGKQVGIVGYGTIGKPIAHALKRLGAQVTVLDADPGAMAEAKKDGHDIPKDRKAFFSGQELIVGATGVRSIAADDLAHLRDGCILGSASSKLVEIDVEGLNALSGRPGGGAVAEVIDDQSHPPTVRYKLADGRKIDLLARGFPVNFDGGVENIDPEKIQLTRCLMLIGALQATGAKVSGVNRLDPRLQVELLEHFDKLEGANLDEEQRGVLSLAQVRLAEAKKDRRMHYRRQR